MLKALEKLNLVNEYLNLRDALESSNKLNIVSQYKDKDACERILELHSTLGQTGRMNKQENIIGFGEVVSKIIILFEDNPLYDNDKKSFISAYPITDNKINKFFATGEIGVSREKQRQYFEKQQATKLKLEHESSFRRRLYNALPDNAKIGKSQLLKAQQLMADIEKMPSLREKLDVKDKMDLARAEEYLKHRDEFAKNFPQKSSDSNQQGDSNQEN